MWEVRAQVSVQYLGVGLRKGPRRAEVSALDPLTAEPTQPHRAEGSNLQYGASHWRHNIKVLYNDFNECRSIGVGSSGHKTHVPFKF